MKTIQLITDAAELYARSQGWRSFDHEIELDVHIPWSFEEALKYEFLESAKIFDQKLIDYVGPRKFSAMRTSNNMILNFISNPDQFSISLTKKESPAEVAGAKVVPMYYGTPGEFKAEGDIEVFYKNPRGWETEDFRSTGAI